MRLVGDLRAARRELETLAAIPVLVDVPVVLGGRIPALRTHRYAGLEAWSDLRDCRSRLDGVQPELAAHREHQRFLPHGAVIARRRSVAHLPAENVT